MDIEGGMANPRVSLLWIVVIYFLWLAQVLLPRWDTSAPSWGLHLPLTEGLSILMGIGVVICADLLLHHLLKEHQEKHIRCACARIIFMFLAGLYLAGVGFHAAAFTIETQLPEGEVKENVHDYLHLLWGHNMFEMGYFALLLFLAWIEYFTFDLRTNEAAEGAPVVRDEPTEGAPVVRNKPTEGAPVVRDEPTEGAPVVGDKPTEGAPVVLYLVKIILPLIMGTSYSVLASIMKTVHLTACFYIAAILMAGVIHYNTDKSSRVWFDSIVITMVVLSSFGGLILPMVLWIFKDVIV